MLPGAQSLDGELGVGIIGGADGYCVDFGIGEEVFCGDINLSTVFGGHLLGAVGAGIEEADQSGIFIGGIFRNVTDLCDFPAADNTDIQHNSTSLVT